MTDISSPLGTARLIIPRDNITSNVLTFTKSAFIVMLQAILKKSTEKEHTNLEQIMYVNDIMDGSLSVEQYAKLLQTNYLIHARYEHLIHRFLIDSEEKSLELTARRKLSALESDLKEAGWELPPAEPLASSHAIYNKATALGAMYVLEGATLGGSVIARKLKTNPTLTSKNLSFSYYQVYGEALGERWKTFVTRLNALPEALWPEAEKGARFMFDEISRIQRSNNAG